MNIKYLLKSTLKKLRDSEFSVALTTTGFATILKLLAGIIINKIIAIKVGPSGIATLGQFTNFRDIMTNAATGSFSQGVTKYIADPKYDEKKVISTAILFSVSVSIFLSICVIALSNYLSIRLFGVSDYQFVFYLFGLTLSFFSVNNLLISIINGKRNYKLLVKVNITNSLVSLILSGLLCWFFALKGALTALALNTTIVLFISLAIIYSLKDRFLVVKRIYWSNTVLRKLLGFTIMALTSALLGPIIQLFLRGYIIDHASQFDAGLWESMKRLSAYYNQIITVSLGVYYLPKLSSLTSNIALKVEILKGIKTIMPIFILMAIGLFFTKKWIINLLFSVKFSEMKTLFLPQLIGDFFMVLSYMIAYLLLAKAMTKTFIITQLTMSGTRIAFSLLFFKINGIEGIIWANALNYFLYSILVIAIFRKILIVKQ